MKRLASRERDIQRLLSFYFILISTLLMLALSVIFSLVQYHTLKRQTIDSLHQIAASVADSLDHQINQMNMISLTAVSSSALQEAFASYNDSSASAYEKTLRRRELVDKMITTKGFDFAIRQLNLYDTGTGGYGVGSYNGDLPVPCTGQDWYEDVRAAAGSLVICRPGTDELIASHSGVSGDQVYFTVCRMILNTLRVPVGFVEIKKFYDEVFSLASQPETAWKGVIAVYTPDGRQIFPLEDGSSSGFSYYNYRDNGTQTLTNTDTGRKEYVSFASSSHKRFFVAAAARRSDLLQPIYRSLSFIFLVFIALMVAGLFLSHLMSRRLSIPIRHIYHFLSNEEKPEFQPLLMEDTHIREIDKLRDSLNESIRAQKSATDTMILLKEQEVQAQMLALQSQMNPHFLYNSLSTLAEMAEEGLTEPVAVMCRDITDIFRYISSNREQRSTVEEEMEICSQYLNCLKIRFGERLSYHFLLPDEMLDFLIPKLCIQLLVENAVKACTTLSPPWEIRISGATDGSRWSVTVQDNGPGFDPDTDRKLHESIDRILETGVLPSLKIEGMGILNIFIRLYLLDRNDFLFDFGNLTEGGAFVRIGGSAQVAPGT